MATTFAKKLAQIAQEQHDRFQGVDENDEPLRGQIEKYWTGIGLSFPGTVTAWSAVFVSWCLNQAGASACKQGDSNPYICVIQNLK